MNRPGNIITIVIAAIVSGITGYGLQASHPVAPVALEVPSGLTVEELFNWCNEHNNLAWRNRLNNQGRNWVQGCDNNGDVQATPSPSPTPSPSMSPTPTQPPTPSPTVTQTTAPPTPTPTTGPQTNCMPVPSACGYPDTTNTGVRFIGPLVIVNGNVTLSTTGMVYERKDVRGCIRITAKNVTIRNVKIRCASDYPIGINTGPVGRVWESADANALIEDVEIDHAGFFTGKGIAFDGYTARRVYYHNGADCFHVQFNVTVEDSYCPLGPDTGGDAFCTQSNAHWDGIQSDEGNHIMLRHNTIRNPCKQTSAILMSTNTLPIGNVTIEGNLMAGGGWTVYCATGEGGPVFGFEIFKNNRIARSYYTWPFQQDHEHGDVGGFYGPFTSCGASNVEMSGNVWDETGLPIPAHGSTW